MTTMQFVRQDQWQPPPQGALHGELTQDGQNIILMVPREVNDWDTLEIRVRLDKLTALAAFTGNTAVIPCTWANVVQIGHSFRPEHGIAWVPHERLRNWIAAESARRMADPPGLETSWPPWLSPRDYQVQDARALAAAGKFLVLHDPGLGKTALTIMGIEQRRRTGTGIFPMVILVPSWDVADVWVREIAQWLPDGAWGEPVIYSGTGRSTGQDARGFRRVPGSVPAPLITTYATATRDAADANGPLARLEAKTVIVDEAHLVKNARAKRTEATERIAKHADTVIGLSGTFITRDMGDAAPMLKAMDHRSWPSKERFVSRFCQVRQTDYAQEITGLRPETEAEFRACLLGQMARRAKADVLESLPPKIYSVRHPDIPEKWMRAYRQMEADMLAAVPGSEEEMSAFDTLTQLTRLSQLASSAADVRTEAVLDKTTGEPVLDEITGLPKTRQVVTLKAPSWKAESLVEILNERRGQGTAAFMDSRQLAMIAGEECAKAGYRCGYVTGTGGGITRGTRARDVGAFQDGALDVIICTSGAGSLGITLTRAGTVVFLQRSWEFDKFVQPEDRAQRLGAEKFSDHIEVIDIVSKGTVDERRRSTARGRAGQLGQFLGDPRIVRELLGGKR